MTSHKPPGGPPPETWFHQRGIFTVQEFLQNHPHHSPRSAIALLAYHVSRGNLFRLKRGLYQDSDRSDPIGVAARWTPDGAIANFAALWVHMDEKQRPEMPSRIDVVSRSQCAPRREEGVPEIHIVKPPHTLGKFGWRTEIGRIDWHGVQIRVTGLERTIVDCLDRIRCVPSVEILWQMMALRRPSVDTMIDYALKLSNASAQARLGFLLHHLPGTTADQLRRLPRRKSTTYFDQMARGAHHRYEPWWNLLVPGLFHAYVTQTDFHRSRPPCFPEIRSW